MEASRMFTAGAGDLAARSGVPCTAAARWPASPTRLLASRHCGLRPERGRGPQWVKWGSCQQIYVTVTKFA